MFDLDLLFCNHCHLTSLWAFGFVIENTGALVRVPVFSLYMQVLKELFFSVLRKHRRIEFY